ncbi:unnamed protein product [Brugia timori]|uniref:Uncharacterized protein n=1 Tax=Brugia timori TaxID=42155 RepID=A0A3P7UAY4_9BILA|nr:unnamed protein product [Brugia timori]
MSECDTILPPRCRRTRRAAKRSNENIRPINVPLKEMNRSWDFTGSIDSDDEYEEIVEAMTFTIATTTATTTTTILTAAPLLTFHPSQQEKLMPSRRRLTIVERVTASGSHSVRSLPLLLVPGFGNTASYPLGKLISAEETPFAVSSPRTNNQPRNGYPHIVDFPAGGMDVKINTQNVTIVSDDHLKQKYQKESVEEFVEETVVQLEQRIQKMIRSDATIVESQVINVRDLEVMSDPNLKEKWCKK